MGRGSREEKCHAGKVEIHFTERFFPISSETLFPEKANITPLVMLIKDGKGSETVGLVIFWSSFIRDIVSLRRMAHIIFTVWVMINERI